LHDEGAVGFFGDLGGEVVLFVLEVGELHFDEFVQGEGGVEAGEESFAETGVAEFDDGFEGLGSGFEGAFFGIGQGGRHGERVAESGVGGPRLLIGAFSRLADGLGRDSLRAVPLVDVRNLKVWFPIRTGIFRRHTGDVKAVDDVSFTIEKGTTVGLVGESGSGKTTIGRALLKLIPATAGEVHYEGSDILPLSEGEVRPYRRRMQMIFQDPFGSLNPRLSIFQIIGEAMEIHFPEMNREARRERVADLLKKVDLKPEMMERYPHEFSGGQRQRIGIARALAVEPNFIVCDEPVSALDVSVQAQIVNLLQDLQEQLGLTYLFIAHDLAVVEHISDHVLVMYHGKIVESAPAEAIYQNPQHDYTKKLLAAVPTFA
jgi:oligopeptide transport system ATP-binding protein